VALLYSNTRPKRHRNFGDVNIAQTEYVGAFQMLFIERVISLLPSDDSNLRLKIPVQKAYKMTADIFCCMKSCMKNSEQNVKLYITLITDSNINKLLLKITVPVSHKWTKCEQKSHRTG